MKIINLILLTVIILSSCQKKNNNQLFVNNTVEVFKNELPKNLIFYREQNNSMIVNTEKYKFLNAEELLVTKNEIFFSLHISKPYNNVSINILSYQTGKSLTCQFDKKGKLISKSTIQTKLMPTKPYYIYYEILKRKYPNYMNWKMFPIPKDSLK